MSRSQAFVRIVVIVFAVIGVAYVGNELDPSSGMSTVGQIALFVGALLVIWIAEKAWNRTKRND